MCLFTYVTFNNKKKLIDLSDKVDIYIYIYIFKQNTIQLSSDLTRIYLQITSK